VEVECFMVVREADGWHRESHPRDVLCGPGLGRWDLPPGSMFWRRHTPLPEDDHPREQPHLAVILPTQDMFCCDCPASDPPHAHWSRTGAPPKVSLSPSIVVGRDPVTWHGWLKDGVLTD
jgi:hypothetical protein